MTNFPTRNQIERADSLTFDGVTRGSDPQIDAVYSAKREHKREQARRAAEALNDPAAPEAEQEAPVEEPPATPAEKPAPAIVLSFETIYRGRLIKITGENMSLDQFCDRLDKKFGLPL